MAATKVKKGQVWKDTKPRAGRRTFTVKAIRRGLGVAEVLSSKGRTTAISLARFAPTFGYKLIKG